MAAWESWVALAGLGAYHGLNPGMGWLFAVAFALQTRRAGAVWLALAPVGLGHAASMLLTAAVLLVGLGFLSPTDLQRLTAAALLALGTVRWMRLARHPPWPGMRPSPSHLFLWSFLTATAHGAGLMAAPWLLGVAAAPGVHVGLPSHGPDWPTAVAGGRDVALAVAVHTLAMFGAMAGAAYAVVAWLGPGVLRRAWINFDAIWTAALVAVGLAAALRSF